MEPHRWGKNPYLTLAKKRIQNHHAITSVGDSTQYPLSTKRNVSEHHLNERSAYCPTYSNKLTPTSHADMKSHHRHSQHRPPLTQMGSLVHRFCSIRPTDHNLLSRSNQNCQKKLRTHLPMEAYQKFQNISATSASSRFRIASRPATPCDLKFPQKHTIQPPYLIQSRKQITPKLCPRRGRNYLAASRPHNAIA